MSRLLWSGFFLVLVLSGCGLNGAPTRHNDFTPLTSIEIIAISPTIAAHTSTKLSVIGNFSGLFTRDITGQAVWSSDAPAVVAFTTLANPDRAWVTGLAPGTANLTVTVGKVSTTFKLTVSSATIQTITITPANPTIAKGLTTQFAASGAFSDLTTQDLTFDATWASSATGVATVSNAVGSKGFAQTLAAGTATITATLDSISGTTLLTVTSPLLQSVKVSPATPSVLTLSAVSFTATGKYSDGTTADITSQVNWTSSNTSVATIIATTGVTTTIKSGTTTITATMANAGGTPVSGTSTLKVTGGTLQSIAIMPATLVGVPLTATNFTLAQGTSARIAAIGTFSNNVSRDITGLVKWTTANANLASVATPGGNLAWLNAVAVTPAATPTTITATSGTVTGTTLLTVTAPTLASITISPTSLNLALGTSSRFTLTANFNDGSTQDVTANSDWTSGNLNIATVGNLGIARGRVSGVAAGTATISAQYGILTTTPLPTVKVSAPTLQSLNIISSGALTAGNQVVYTATATYSDSTSFDVTEDTTWSIDNQNVAIPADSVNQPGQVVLVDSGSATLTASFRGKTQSATVAVP